MLTTLILAVATTAAALESIRQWRFEPTMLYGKRVPVVLGIRVEFVLTLGRD